MKIRILNPRECLLEERSVGDIVDVYWDQELEAWRESYKEDPAGFLTYWFEKGYFEFVEDGSQEPTKQASTTLDKIKTFTMNHKDIEISFEDGMIVVRDWDIRFREPVDYHVDTIEQLEEFMDAFEVVMKFCKKEDV